MEHRGIRCVSHDRHRDPLLVRRLSLARNQRPRRQQKLLHRDLWRPVEEAAGCRALLAPQCRVPVTHPYQGPQPNCWNMRLARPTVGHHGQQKLSGVVCVLHRLAPRRQLVRIREVSKQSQDNRHTRPMDSEAMLERTRCSTMRLLWRFPRSEAEAARAVIQQRKLAGSSDACISSIKLRDPVSTIWPSSSTSNHAWEQHARISTYMR
eukprot:1249958-Rhodomonas_salina.3